jgi:putative flippase GtrA
MEATTRLPMVLQGPGVRKLVKYSMVSLISVVVSQAALFVAYAITGHAVLSNIIAVAVGTLPSYELNRRWTWRKSGPSHLWREIVPFWVMSFIGLVFSTMCVYFAERWADGRHMSEGHKSLVLLAANLGAFGVLWVGKFVIINRLLFHHQPLATADEDDVPVF